MDQLRAIFPDLDVSTLEATLAAHGGSVERAVDYLLATHSPDPERAAQEEEDAALARRLQAEDAAVARDPYGGRTGTTQDAHPASLGSHRPPQESTSFALPSLADVQSAVQPIVTGVTQAGRMAANSVSGLYRELVGEDVPNRPSTESRDIVRDEAVVVRGDGSSPAATRSSTRQRRPESSIGRSNGDKKDD